MRLRSVGDGKHKDNGWCFVASMTSSSPSTLRQQESCVGGPIAHKLEPGITGITDDWLFTHVNPNARRRFPNDSQLCQNLALAMLFAAMDPVIGETLPQAMQDRIAAAHISTNNEEQPVRRVPLNIHRIQDTLMIDDITEDPTGAAPGGTNGSVGNGGNGDSGNGNHNAAPLVNVQRIQQQQASNHQQALEAIAEQRQWSIDQFRTINNDIRAFGGTIQGSVASQDPQQQARHRQSTDLNQQIANPGSLPAALAETPWTLAELWEECQFGIGGWKTAKDWEAFESGNTQLGIKQKHHRRTSVWHTVEMMMRLGSTRDGAIRKIRQAHGWRCSVT